MARPRSIDPVVVSASFSYNIPVMTAGSTVDVTLTSTADPAIGRLRVNFNVNLWASAALPNGVSIVNQACFVAGQLYFRLSSTTAVTATPVTLFLQQM
jgi:hypothetical protein